jgi:crotonobetainyl-CoA:carnitine CoA-transferase CaiB-like acyl-CoA transferase
MLSKLRCGFQLTVASGTRRLSKMTGALKDIRIVDLTHAQSGPVASQMLADLGAEVIKIENPLAGDLFRAIDDVVQGASSYYLALNRNKRSMTLNLKDPMGKKIFFDLVKDADVCIENFTPGVVERLGVGYGSVKEVADAIIYCHISGYGQTGPYRDRPAFDQIMQGEAGLLSMAGSEASPARVPIPITDIMAGKDAAFAIVAALHHRDRTGEGQELDVSMFASCVASYYQFLYRYWYKNEAPKRWATRHPFMVPYGVYSTKDGLVNVAALGDSQWHGLCAAIGHPELGNHKNYARMEDRVAHRDELEEILQESMSRKTSDEWVEVLTRNGVPCGNVNDMSEVLSHPQLDHYNMVQEVHDEARDMELKLLSFPVGLSETPSEVRRTPPVLGEHTDGILAELGYSTSEISELRDRHIV